MHRDPDPPEVNEEDLCDAAMATALTALMTDGRLPTGSYAHSLGLEEAVHRQLVANADDVAAYTAGILASVGVGGAALAVAAWELAAGEADARSWRYLDAEADARMASPVQRSVSRQLGRHLLRVAPAFGPTAADAVHAASAGHSDGPHQSTAAGALAATIGLTATHAATAYLYGTAQVVSQAAVRLLGLDPVAATSIVVALAPWIARTAADLSRQAAPVDAERLARFGDAVAALTAPAAPLLDHLLFSHHERPERLFVT